MAGINSKSLEYRFSCLVILIVMLWAPLNKWVLMTDGAGRIPLTLLTISVLLLSSGLKKISWHKPITIYLIFAIYLFTNGLIQHGYEVYEGNGVYIMFVNIFNSVLYLTIVSYLAYSNFNQTLKWITWGLLIYCILCLIFSGTTDEGRLGGDLNSNGMATYAQFAYMALLMQFMRKQRSFISLIILSIAPILLIVMSGSRTAFILLAVVTFASVLLFYKKEQPGSLFLLIIVAVILIVGSFYVMNNTVLGERLQDSTTQMEGNMYETGTVIDKFGDRGPQYYWSWPYFLEHPIFGLGLNNWRKVSGFRYVFHSEWLVQYCENGLVALFLYLSFYFLLLKKTIASLKVCPEKEKKSIKVLVFALISIFLLNFVSWTYNSFCVFAFYGLVIANVWRNNYCVES